MPDRACEAHGLVTCRCTMAAEDTRPSTPRAKLSTHNRLQIRELVRTWLEMCPKRRHARTEFENDVMWAIIRDERGHMARVPLGDDDIWIAWGRAMSDLPPKDEPT